MRAEAVVTLIGAGLLVAALVTYLSLVAYHLSRVNFALGTVLIGVRSIANQTEPIEGVVGSIAADVSGIDAALAALVAVAAAPATARTRRSRAKVSS